MDGVERAGASRGAIEVLGCGAFFQCPPHDLAERSVCTRGALALFTSCGASDAPAVQISPGCYVGRAGGAGASAAAILRKSRVAFFFRLRAQDWVVVGDARGWRLPLAVPRPTSWLVKVAAGGGSVELEGRARRLMSWRAPVVWRFFVSLRAQDWVVVGDARGCCFPLAAPRTTSRRSEVTIEGIDA
jgi:hypothetical protein